MCRYCLAQIGARESGYPRPSTPISKDLNPFLDHDSHVEAGILEVDEFEAEEAARRGICGRLNPCHKPAILDAHLGMPIINERDKAVLRMILAD